MNFITTPPIIVKTIIDKQRNIMWINITNRADPYCPSAKQLLLYKKSNAIVAILLFSILIRAN